MGDEGSLGIEGARRRIEEMKRRRQEHKHSTGDTTPNLHSPVLPIEPVSRRTSSSINSDDVMVSMLKQEIAKLNDIIVAHEITILKQVTELKKQESIINELKNDNRDLLLVKMELDERIMDLETELTTSKTLKKPIEDSEDSKVVPEDQAVPVEVDTAVEEVEESLKDEFVDDSVNQQQENSVPDNVTSSSPPLFSQETEIGEPPELSESNKPLIEEVEIQNALELNEDNGKEMESPHIEEAVESESQGGKLEDDPQTQTVQREKLLELFMDDPLLDSDLLDDELLDSDGINDEETLPEDDVHKERKERPTTEQDETGASEEHNNLNMEVVLDIEETIPELKLDEDKGNIKQEITNSESSSSNIFEEIATPGLKIGELAPEVTEPIILELLEEESALENHVSSGVLDVQDNNQTKDENDSKAKTGADIQITTPPAEDLNAGVGAIDEHQEVDPKDLSKSNTTEEVHTEEDTFEVSKVTDDTSSNEQSDSIDHEIDLNDTVNDLNDTVNDKEHESDSMIDDVNELDLNDVVDEDDHHITAISQEDVEITDKTDLLPEVTEIESFTKIREGNELSKSQQVALGLAKDISNDFEDLSFKTQVTLPSTANTDMPKEDMIESDFLKSLKSTEFKPDDRQPLYESAYNPYQHVPEDSPYDHSVYQDSQYFEEPKEHMSVVDVGETQLKDVMESELLPKEVDVVALDAPIEEHTKTENNLEEENPEAHAFLEETLVEAEKEEVQVEVDSPVEHNVNEQTAFEPLTESITDEPPSETDKPESSSEDDLSKNESNRDILSTDPAGEDEEEDLPASSIDVTTTYTVGLNRHTSNLKPPIMDSINTTPASSPDAVSIKSKPISTPILSPPPPIRSPDRPIKPPITLNEYLPRGSVEIPQTSDFRDNLKRWKGWQVNMINWNISSPRVAL
ncbi:uncharacterized protein KQ657_002199 [Scheffersomyces spartinae]|uniref:Uncharacterized protein n=1 Tax=Scheffersomyces spartinae TaxID=45513 RepID=A0A9P8AL81_9ASCO|nr:uncharacterized protein KQ657_002199 [Scheffersomyces spartinae]KAG7195814.1 hypothetical protein KQ657_002199 [Scheffersomyces spartinae]